MDPTYTFDITNLVGILQRIAEFAHQLWLWTGFLIPSSRGFLATFANINNISSQVHVVIGFSTNANIKAMIITSGSYKTYPHTFQA